MPPQTVKDRAFIELSRRLESQGDLEQALATCEKELNRHPDSVTAHALKGKILLRLGKIAEAMVAFDAALAIDKTHPFPPLLIAQILLERGLLRSALPLLKRSISLHSDNPVAPVWLEKAQSGLLTQGKPPAWVSDASSLFDEVPTQFESAAPPAVPWLLPAEPVTREVPHPLVPLLAKKPLKEIELSVDIDEDFDEPPSLPAPLALNSPPPPPEAISEPPPPPKVGLLDDIPEYQIPAAPAVPLASSPALSEEDRREMAVEYESNLRERLEGRRSRRRVVLGSVLLGSVLAASALAYFFTRVINQGQGFEETLSSARKNIGLDTYEAYLRAADQLSRAASMDDQSEEAWALSAYVHAVLYAEYGAAPAQQRESASALAHPRVRVRQPGWAVVSDYYLGGMQPSDHLKEQILTPPFELSELWELGARIYLRDGNFKAALQDWKKALELSSTSARALSGLGEYYRQSGDCTTALKFYEKASELSPLQVENVLGRRECQLDLGQGAAHALDEIQELKNFPSSLSDRKILLESRLLTVEARAPEAKALLRAAIESNPSTSYEFYLSLSDLERRNGSPLEALTVAEKALALDPKGQKASEAVARLYLQKGSYRELLSRFSSTSSSGIQLTRAIALARLKDWKGTRAALAKTQVEGKYPAEAIIYLALADAAEGHAPEAQKILEQLLISSKKSKNEIRIALGQLYISRGSEGQARVLLEQAAQDSSDYEAACTLGRLEMKRGDPRLAERWLLQAVLHNPLHSEAWRALGQLQLERGQREEALKSFRLGGMSEDIALALYHLGRFDEANTELGRSEVPIESSAELQRLKAMILFSIGKGKAGFASLEASNKLNPKSAETFCAIGMAFGRSGNTRGMVQAFSAAIRESSREPCGLVGKIFAELPRAPSSSLTQLRQAREKSSRFWDRAFADAVLSALFLERENIGEAESYAHSSVEQAPFSGLSHATLAKVLARVGKQGDALKEFNTALQLDPSDGVAHLGLADFLSRQVLSANSANSANSDRRRALDEYQAFLSIGGTPAEVKRVQKIIPVLRKRLSAQ